MATKREKIRIVKTITFLLLALYIAYVLYLTIFQRIIIGQTNYRGINYFPFKTITSYMKTWIYNGSGNRNIAMNNILGNIYLFIPFGFFASFVVLNRKKFILVTFYAFLFSLIIECTQYLLSVGISDIDDIILNIIGAIVGYLIFEVFKFCFTNS